MYTFGSINNVSLFSFFPRFCLCFFSSFLFSRRDSISFFFSSTNALAFLPKASTKGMSFLRFGSRRTRWKETQAARMERRRVHLVHFSCSSSSCCLVLDFGFFFLDVTSYSSSSSSSSARALLFAGAAAAFFADGGVVEERI